jgi:hypothetical protein
MLSRALRLTCLILTGTVLSAARAEEKPPAELNGLPLLFHDDFSGKDAQHWAPGDPKAWKITEQDGNRVYSQFAASKVQTPVRSPFNRSLLKDIVVSSFILDVKLQSTGRDYGHRDMCLFYGFQDPAHMYYTHFGQKTDDHANQTFIVNNAPRTKISTQTTSGTPWNDEWHHARIVRDVDSGRIEVYFDDMQTPAMVSVDKTFTRGQIGLGSFDDTGNFDDVRLYGIKAQRPE